MDYLTRQLLLELTKLREAFDKQNATISAIDERTRKQEQFQRKLVDDISSKYDQSVRDGSVQQERDYGIHNSTRKATWLAAIAAVVAAAGAWWYACITNGTWKEMQRQTVIQKQTGVNAERAWIGLEDPIVVDSLEVVPDFRLSAHYKIKNVGHGPALKIVPAPWVITDFGNLAEEKRLADFTCEGAQKISTGTVPMEPNLENPGPLGYTLFTNQDRQGTIQWNVVNIKNFRGFQIVVCVSYLDQFRQVHWTRFCMQSPIKPQPISKDSPLDFCSLYNDTDQPKD